ncbi:MULTISPECIES: LuxR C-terminal-related transcriptional regulator [unclassified Oceanobacillus]|uniref:LuxR C-terminal-related transcriptional regulator n=1 Tax=unclassified Oceanobacillus TaxID=2630292 RepID=UPI00300DE789
MKIVIIDDLIFLKKNNQEIAEELELPAESVRYNVSKIYKTLKLKSRAETTRYLNKLINNRGTLGSEQLSPLFLGQVL